MTRGTETSMESQRPEGRQQDAVRSDGSVDVVVVGAGLAGLRCAGRLLDAGLDVVVLEAEDEVGGRIRSERIDGFTLDRGFQVVNPAYAALQAAVDVDRLRLQHFPAGVRVRTDGGLRSLGDPLRAPGLLGSSVLLAGARPREVAALARWAAPLIKARHRAHGLPADLLSARPDTSVAASLDAAGAHGLLRDVLQRYLAGVVLEDDGSTSTAFALLLARSFVRGTPGLPADGVDALPRALASGLGGRVRLGRRVVGVEGRGDRVDVRVADGTLSARRVVLATDPWSLGAALGGPSQAPGARGSVGSVTVPEPKGVVTDWYAVEEPPSESGILHLDVTDARRPVINTSLVAAVAPDYAPPGRHLVQVTSLLHRGTAVPEPETRRHAGEIFGVATDRWELVRRHEIAHALPVQPAPLRPRGEQRLAGVEGLEGLAWVCGDHLDTGSQQGALVSGARAARAVLESLGLASRGPRRSRRAPVAAGDRRGTPWA